MKKAYYMNMKNKKEGNMNTFCTYTFFKCEFLKTDDVSFE